MIKPRILLVEDEPGIADTIRYVLDSQGFEPLWCATGTDALDQLDDSIALIILDVGLPDINGFDLFRQIQGRCQVPVVFLTARSDEIDRIVGLELGADDYIAKPFSPRELAARVRTILRRSSRVPVSGNSAQAESSPGTLPLQIDEERRQIRFHGRLLDLSRYEYGILRLLLSRPGRVYTRDELLYQVWGNPEDSNDRTVDAHIKLLRQKLKVVRPEGEVIRTHRGIGYSLSEDYPA